MGDLVTLREINTSNSIDTQLFVKQEPQSEFLDNFSIETVPSVSILDWCSQVIKNEAQSDEEIIKIPSKKREVQKASNPYTKKVCRNGKPNKTELPCIVNIKSSVQEKGRQKNHNGTLNISDEMSNASLQSPISEKTCDFNVLDWSNGIAGQTNANSTCESYNHIAHNETAEQNSSSNTLSKVYQILVDIQSTLKDLKAEVGENSQKIDQLQKFLPQQWSWKNVKSDFDFPVSTEEKFLELENELNDSEIASKLFVHLTSRTYTSWTEMVRFCLKYMLSRNVATLYNLNGVKGSKKKFRDRNMCNILIECVKYKYKEVPPPNILRRISLILAGAGDWERSRRKDNCKI